MKLKKVTEGSKDTGTRYKYSSLFRKCSIQCAYYCVDFEKNDKPLHSKSDSERPSVYTVYCYAIKIKSIKTLVYICTLNIKMK